MWRNSTILSVSPELISKVTDAVHEEIRQWQSRPLEESYAIVYFDAVRVKIRDEGLVRNKAVYLAIGVSCAGVKEVLGLWIEQTEGAKFWLSVMNELKARGTTDVLIAVVDGLKGFPEAIEAVYPEATVQTCIVHLLRHSLAHGSWKERRALGAALKPIYQAQTEADAAAALDEFEAGPWGAKYPAIARSWRARWEEITPFLAFSAPIRRAIYTTNAIESLNSTVRRAVRTRGHFPSDRAATKLIYLALRNVAEQMEEAASVLAPSAYRVFHPVRRAVSDAGVVNPRSSRPGNATACLASNRYAVPLLRVGPTGDPRQSAAYRFTMIVSTLTTMAGRPGHSEIEKAMSKSTNPGGPGRQNWSGENWFNDSYNRLVNHGGADQPTTAPHTEILTPPKPSVSSRPNRIAGGLNSPRSKSSRKATPTPGSSGFQTPTLCPFSTRARGQITRFTNGRDPNPRSREVFTFHRPETFKTWTLARRSLRSGIAVLPPLNSAGLRDCQGAAITNLEASLRADKPRALVQMATGAGKTFAAITQVYRLLKHADARRILFLVDTRNLGRAGRTGVHGLHPQRRQPQVHRTLQRPAPRLAFHCR